MTRGEPREGNSERVLGKAEGDVREGLGRWSDRGADGGFAGVGGESDGRSEKRSDELLGGSELRSGAVGKQRGDRDANESVESAPEKIEGGDFVGEEFNGEERCAGGDDGPCFEELESWREREMSEAREQPEGGHGGVDVESGGEGDGGEQREEFGERDLQPVGHEGGKPRS